MTRKSAGKRIAALIAAVVMLSLLPLVRNVSPAAAADQPSAALSVSPPTTSLDATPGSKLTQKIGLDNISDDARQITVVITNFGAAGEEGQAQLEDNSDPNSPYSLSQWIAVSPSKTTIPAHGHQDFNVTINVPKNAPPGGHFGAIVFSPENVGGNGGASLSVVSRVSSLILLRVPGDATEKASLAGVNICKLPKGKVTCDKSTGFFQSGPITMTARLSNEGNVQVQPQGTITIYNMFGSKVATLKIDQRNLLPDSIRRFDTTWKSKTLFGMYKAKFDLTYGTNPQQLHFDKSFIGLPLMTIGIVVFVLILVFLIFWLPRKRIKKAFKAFAAAGE